MSIAANLKINLKKKIRFVANIYLKNKNFYHTL